MVNDCKHFPHRVPLLVYIVYMFMFIIYDNNRLMCALSVNCFAL
jgi:hypothetical protein